MYSGVGCWNRHQQQKDSLKELFILKIIYSTPKILHHQKKSKTKIKETTLIYLLEHGQVIVLQLNSKINFKLAGRMFASKDLLCHNTWNQKYKIDSVLWWHLIASICVPYFLVIVLCNALCQISLTSETELDGAPPASCLVIGMFFIMANLTLFTKDSRKAAVFDSNKTARNLFISHARETILCHRQLFKESDLLAAISIVISVQTAGSVVVDLAKTERSKQKNAISVFRFL